MNGTYKIKGGVPLKGEVHPIANKNSILGALPLAVIANGPLTISRLPRTSDVELFLKIYQQCGASINICDLHTSIDCSSINSIDVPGSIGKHFRGAFSLVGPLLARFGRANLHWNGAIDRECGIVHKNIFTIKQLERFVSECSLECIESYVIHEVKQILISDNEISTINNCMQNKLKMVDGNKKYLQYKDEAIQIINRIQNSGILWTRQLLMFLREKA